MPYQIAKAIYVNLLSGVISLLLIVSFKANAETISVYFGTAGESANGIYSASFNTTTGLLTNINQAHTIEAPRFLTIHPTKNVLYAVAKISDKPVVAAFHMHKNGNIELLNAEPIGDTAGTHIAVHPTGAFLLTAQYGGGSVAVFPLDTSGRVMQKSQLIKHVGSAKVNTDRQTSPHPHWVGFSPDGNYAFVPDLGLDQILIYKINIAESTLIEHARLNTAPGAGPRHMRFSINGKYIYVLNELNLTIATFIYHPEKGTAELIANTNTLDNEAKDKELFNSASEILVHPSGNYVYSGNRGNDSVSVFRANDQNGSLKAIEVEPIRGAWPRSIGMDPNGKWLFAAGVHSNTVAIFSINQNTGELSFPRESIYSIPEPVSIVFH